MDIKSQQFNKFSREIQMVSSLFVIYGLTTSTMIKHQEVAVCIQSLPKDPQVWGVMQCVFSTIQIHYMHVQCTVSSYICVISKDLVFSIWPVCNPAPNSGLGPRLTGILQ